MGSSAFTPEDRGALRATQDKVGDCTEHAYLFAALPRANGVPARVMGGYLLPESGLLRPYDYHNWAAFYQDGAWRLADPHQGNFIRNASKYVATHVMSGSGSSLLGAPASVRRHWRGPEGHDELATPSSNPLTPKISGLLSSFEPKLDWTSSGSTPEFPGSPHPRFPAW